MKKLVITHPNKTTETVVIRIGLHLHEGDAGAPVPGGLYASATLINDKNSVIHSRDFGPDDLTPYQSIVNNLKDTLMKDLGIEEIDEPDEEAPKEESQE